MAKKIKLENIVNRGYDRMTGETVEEVTEEFVCENCRHLVGVDDKFCWQCGEKLKQSELVEHYHKGKQITDLEYKKRRTQYR